MRDFTVGVDLGQESDFTAVTAVEAVEVEAETSREHRVVHLERWRRSPYPEQVRRIRDIYKRVRELGRAELVVDMTGVGRAVVDLLVDAGLRPTAVTITGGGSVTHQGAEYRVPKRDLVSSLQVVLQTGRLRVAEGLPLAQELTSELLGFKMSLTTSGHDRYGNDVGERREARHDDLVLALALAVWRAERSRAPVRIRVAAVGARRSNWDV